MGGADMVGSLVTAFPDVLYANLHHDIAAVVGVTPAGQAWVMERAQMANAIGRWDPTQPLHVPYKWVRRSDTGQGKFKLVGYRRVRRIARNRRERLAQRLAPSLS